MDKGIGYNRNIFLCWMEEAARLAAETGDQSELRAGLQPIVSQQIVDSANRRKAIDILVNVWFKTRDADPALWHDSLIRIRSGAPGIDRLWLHYGLTVLYYPFFRQTTAVIGQLTRLQGGFTSSVVKQRLTAELGELGSLSKATERVVFSLRDWGILTAAGARNAYKPRINALSATDIDLEAWLLACVLRAHPSEEIPFADLVRLPELFPFRFTLTVDDLRRRSRFTVQRQGSSWDMVRLAE